jgi:hypothetical protein
MEGNNMSEIFFPFYRCKLLRKIVVWGVSKAIHTHTHTHTQRERERQTDRQKTESGNN